MSLKVLKFGGSSVGSAEALRRAAGIVREQPPGTGGGIHPAGHHRPDPGCLLRRRAGGDLPAAQSILSAIQVRHQSVAEELRPHQAVAAAWAPCPRMGPAPDGHGHAGRDHGLGPGRRLAVGETLSANLAALASRGPSRMCGRSCRPMPASGKARPGWSPPRGAAIPRRQALATRPLVTQGFLGSSPEGVTTTLGRGGSDTSATLLGEALDAEEGRSGRTWTVSSPPTPAW
ncbi:MAG: hypothetical protein IPO28_15000 [Holophagaceae bacterium]|nr:hypothetical protein [Holophagaceae bacterium]